MAEKEEETPLEKAGFDEEIAEEFNAAQFGAYVKTGFPKPARRYRLVYESDKASIEHTYFWVYNHTLQDWSFGNIIKTVDTFAASENSSFWGMTEQRKGMQQEKASQFLATIGRMVKELFQIVREIRILKERLRLYKESAEGKQASDIALKGYWVDFVEGGAKGGANIYTMARDLGFGTLPDLFFSTYVKDDGDVDKVVEDKAKEFNTKVKEVLKRKLALYMAWKKETEQELKVRERFTLRYLRQHWAVIRMYSSWVRPYLRNVQKLSAPDKYDKNPELISSFEGALMEIEFLARRAPKKEGGPAETVLATFNYRTMPQMAYNAESGRGALHVGRVEFCIRCYGWTDKDVEAYVKFREQETLQLLEMIDGSVKDAMEALGKDLLDYLKEAGENLPELKEEEAKAAAAAAGKPKKKDSAPSVNIFEPFAALYGGFKDMALMPFGGEMFTFKAAETKKKGRGDMGVGKGAAKQAFNIFKLYKKAHGMPAW